MAAVDYPVYGAVYDGEATICVVPALTSLNRQPRELFGCKDLSHA
jgi:hypothetical protein